MKYAEVAENVKRAKAVKTNDPRFLIIVDCRAETVEDLPAKSRSGWVNVDDASSFVANDREN
jgi:hypothetical protein